MKFKYRLSKVKILNLNDCDGVFNYYKFSHYKYIIEKKCLFGWKIYLDNISDKKNGFKLLKELQNE